MESSEGLRVPPQDIDIERSLLALLLCGLEADIILGEVKAAHFYRTAHQLIFQSCQDVYSKENVIDIALVFSNLGDKKDQAGGHRYLSALLDEPTPSNVESYCKKLKELYQLRRIIEISNAAIKRSFSARPDEADSVIDYLSSELILVSEGRGSGWCSMRDLVVECVDNCEELQKHGGVTGVPSGFAWLDFYTAGWQKGDLIILAARPGCGKTAFVVNSSQISAKQGFKNGFISLEMSRVPIGNRFLSVVGRVNSTKFRSGRLSQTDWDMIHDASEQLSDLPIWVDDSPRASFQEVQKKARSLHSKHGLDVLWIDYLGFLDGDKATRSKVQEIESITRGMKSLAKELCIPVVLLSQLNRECEKRDNKRPQLADLRDSGAIEQDADVVLFLYRDSKYNPDTLEKGIAECEIAKQRNGPTARVKLKWTEEFMRFDNLERDERNG